MFPKYVEEVFSSPPGIIILECLGSYRDAHNLLKINPFLRESLNLFIRRQDYKLTLNFLGDSWWITRTFTHFDKELNEKFSEKQLENELSKVWLFDFMVLRQVFIGNSCLECFFAYQQLIQCGSHKGGQTQEVPYEEDLDFRRNPKLTIDSKGMPLPPTSTPNLNNVAHRHRLFEIIPNSKEGRNIGIQIVRV